MPAEGSVDNNLRLLAEGRLVSCPGRDKVTDTAHASADKLFRVTEDEKPRHDIEKKWVWEVDSKKEKKK